MNQEAIGKFILSCRKEKGLTQVQLAEKLNITDRAVSKWETGKSIPDVSIMPELCEILGITVNELFSGERMNSMEDYKKNAEQNMTFLMMTLKQLKIFEILTLILIGVGIALTISSGFIFGEMNQKILFIVMGAFIWIFGLCLRIQIKKTLDCLDK